MATDTVNQDLHLECNKLCAKLSQLQAMLFVTYGYEEGSFTEMDNEMKDNYLSACFDMAAECCTLSETIDSKVHHQMRTT